ncbi:hypothetical protein PVK06_041158 [Gossypium arboreum]|uniref:DC1 domain-containing protein n=1 Tax=Gossypium arboreum TaxID=29729 RepID=A0ABR0N7G1_GOSAR|nr:hypothetical protein PVK06_041158 [Gossypium arboreum]
MVSGDTKDGCGGGSDNKIVGMEKINYKHIRLSLYSLARLIHSNDNEQVLTNAFWALSYLSDGTNDKIQVVIKTGLIWKHISCADKLNRDLPLEIIHPLHLQHRLQLLWGYDTDFICDKCLYISTGYRYICYSCDFYLDLTCASSVSGQLPKDQEPFRFKDGKKKTIFHYSHCHKLGFLKYRKNYTGDKESLGKCEQVFEFKRSLNTVNSACNEVRNSLKLKDLMKKISLSRKCIEPRNCKG